MLPQPRLTICLPCFGRPKRTVRAIESIMAQAIDGWEAFVIGDNCPDFQKLLESGYFASIIKAARDRGNSLVASNLPINHGGYGYEILNRVKALSNGMYTVYFNNDDLLKKNHFEHYLSEIEGTDLDFVYYNSWMNTLECVRHSRLTFGNIGHSELIIRTEFLKQMPKHTPDYGHDWQFIQTMLERGAKHKKAVSEETTYLVMGTPDRREEIED